MPLALRVPIVGNYELTAKFNQSGGLWTSGKHTGQDFAAPAGRTVVAAASGMVTFAGSSGKYGNRVEITHANGMVTTYSHLATIAVSRFEVVESGEKVGSVGETGNTTGPHLHFEVKLGGIFVDPMKYIGVTGGPAPVPNDPDASPVPVLSGIDVTAGSTWLRVAYFLAGLIVLGLALLAVRKGGLK
jgi:murein DD-endopeptidase MepM/ murein hydrolase activator NlpD